MSKKSTKLNKAFDKKHLIAARKIVSKYEIILTEADGEFYGRGLEIPTVFGDGSSPDDCMKNTKDALVATVAHLLERGGTVPAPASEGKRTEQVNIRLTPVEKTILGASARSQGFRGLADFIRAKALSLQAT